MLVNWRDFSKRYKTGNARRKALSGMSDSEIDYLAKSLNSKAGQAAIAAYKTKNKKEASCVLPTP